jgi:DNA invertase Pin-like site-specific DNA recombinase
MEQQRPIVSYLRVSTERSQGANGLGIDGQRATVADFCQRGGFTLSKEFVEVESGRNNERTVLAKALAHARRIGATLLVAKLDRLSRSVRFIATVLDAGVEFRACDVPDASRLLLHILSAVAEAEAAAISQRTKVALKAARERGTLLGAQNPACRNLTAAATARGRVAGQAANRAKAIAAFVDVLPTITALREEGLSLRAIAERLNAEFPREGGCWQAAQVKRVLDRLRAHTSALGIGGEPATCSAP